MIAEKEAKNVRTTTIIPDLAKFIHVKWEDLKDLKN
jgi:hypothetical protein